MDVFERVFHVSPDGGNGSLELTYVIAALAAGLTWSLRRFFAFRARNRIR